VHALDSDTKNLITQIKNLNENIEILTKVTAISLAKDEIFRGKKETIEKIEALEIYDLPDKIIALVIGSTPDSVKSLRSKRKRTLKEITNKGIIQKAGGT
jgi:hypothetical protein